MSLRDRLRSLQTVVGDSVDRLRYRIRRTAIPPHAVKARLVIDAARRHRLHVLVETGTCLGDMVRKCASSFEDVRTIELSPELAAESRRRLANLRNVRIYCGNSATLLRDVLRELATPSVFWLDAHYSGGRTAKADRETPLEQELRLIAEHGRPGSVVLIDDAHCLGTGDYPTLEAVRAMLSEIDRTGSVSVSDNIVRLEPSA
jgi:hypothetical protein